MAVQVQLRGDTAANWASANPIIAVREMVVETDTNQFKIGNGVDHYVDLPYGGITGPAQTNVLDYFSSGIDLNMSLSAGSTVLTRDMYLNTLTISGTAQLVTNGFRLFCNTLDVSQAGAFALVADAIGDGATAITQAGASGGAGTTTGTVSGALSGSAGGTGVVGVGATAAASTGASPSNGGSSGAGGAGGAGGSGAGGAARAAASAANPSPIGRPEANMVRGITLIQGGASGPGGSSGAGDGVNLGRGGGGGGAGGGVLCIFARNIIKSNLTSANCFAARGKAGGNGASATVGNVGGGGGGAGGGGGYIFLCYESATGPTVTNMLNASGGDGGIGGNGFGTGIGGNGGGGGSAGRIYIVRTLDRTGLEYIGLAGNLGSPGVGVSGGAAGAGASLRVDF